MSQIADKAWHAKAEVPAMVELAKILPTGLYGSGMHDFVITEAELGNRVALYADEADLDPMACYFDIKYQQYEREAGAGA
jgi:hypothetical protein